MKMKLIFPVLAVCLISCAKQAEPDAPKALTSEMGSAIESAEESSLFTLSEPPTDAKSLSELITYVTYSNDGKSLRAKIGVVDVDGSEPQVSLLNFETKTDKEATSAVAQAKGKYEEQYSLTVICEKATESCPTPILYLKKLDGKLKGEAKMTITSEKVKSVSVLKAEGAQVCKKATFQDVIAKIGNAYEYDLAEHTLLTTVVADTNRVSYRLTSTFTFDPSKNSEGEAFKEKVIILEGIQDANQEVLVSYGLREGSGDRTVDTGPVAESRIIKNEAGQIEIKLASTGDVLGLQIELEPKK